MRALPTRKRTRSPQRLAGRTCCPSTTASVPTEEGREGSSRRAITASTTVSTCSPRAARPCLPRVPATPGAARVARSESGFTSCAQSPEPSEATRLFGPLSSILTSPEPTSSRARWHPVSSGATVGTVGKSGNASGPSIQPHVHLELVVHASEDDARRETHYGRNQSSHDAADTFFARLQESCLGPNGFAPKGRSVRRARRADPFVVLICLGAEKPPFRDPAGPLAGAGVRWSAIYEAKTFNVDTGRIGLQPTHPLPP